MASAVAALAGGTEEGGAETEADELQHNPSTSAGAAALDAMRAYRACLHCRSRKTKCNLDVNGGKPPCKRCQRENRECILGESHRGGRRVRKKPKLTVDLNIAPPQVELPSVISAQIESSEPRPTSSYNPTQSYPYAPDQRYENAYDSHHPWQSNANSAVTRSGSDDSSYQGLQENQAAPYKSRSQVNDQLESSRVPARESIAIADLHNPSDALDILALVADREDDESKRRIGVPRIDPSRSVAWQNDRSPPKFNDHLYYKPVNDGLISPDHVYYLFSSFQKNYHAYFPVVPSDSFRKDKIPWLSKAEPHLFSAILTVASKDDAKTHQICYDHMQSLVSMIVAGADADVEAVEALLLLSQWISHRPQMEKNSVGRGEEGRVAWMYVGTALRLGWYLGIDQTAFKGEPTEGLALYNRKRVLWSACYVADRNISVRLGKGFWAIGPGPLQFSDFPSLRSNVPGEDNLEVIFQAHLSLAQIFSNVHDILYCSKGYGWMEMLEGRYAKYLDDFRTSIRNWDEKWGKIECSSPLKGSLLLSFDYLRLYVNAFAYQATISRAMLQFKGSQARPIPLLDAGAPDARFIYEAISAAKSLLTTFNTVIEPHVLRCMPYRYCLYAVYSAVFLYKARSTTTMSEGERFEIRRLISSTIDRLERSSLGANQTGSRYARLLQLLWRKAPRTSSLKHTTSISQNSQALPPQQNDTMSNLPQFDPSALNNLAIPHYGNGQAHNGGTFSWLDLGGAWNYATQDDGMAGVGNAMHSQGIGMEEAMANAEPGPYSMNLNLLADYRLLGDDNPGLIF